MIALLDSYDAKRMSFNTYEYDLTSAFNPHGACDYCHKRKMRCDKAKPQCNECVKRNIQCNYGLRLKRGPKMKKSREPIKEAKQDQQIQIIQKSNSGYDAMLFEYAFNKKMAELWKSLCVKEGSETEFKDFIPQIRPQFDPATEAFIRSPNAVNYLMEDFDKTLRIMFSVPDFASNVDFATKIWQAIIEINLPNFLTLLNEFETPLLITMLEYFMVFLLGLKVSHYDEMAAYIAKIIYHIVNLVVYHRNFSEECLTSAYLPIQLIGSMVFLSGYFKMCKNGPSLQANAKLTYELYHQYKSAQTLNKDLEARLCCRILMTSKTQEARDYWTNQITTLLGNNVSANLLFHLNLHLSMHALYNHKDMTEAEKNVQKAEYFVHRFLDQLPDERRSATEGYYDGWVGVIHSEIAMRMGNVELAKKKVGQLLELFPRLSPPCQRLLKSHCDFFIYRTGDLLVKDYLLLMDADPALYKPIRNNNANLNALPNAHVETIESDDNSNSNYNSNENSSPSLFEVNTGSLSEEIPTQMEIPDPFFAAEPYYYSINIYGNGM